MVKMLHSLVTALELLRIEDDTAFAELDLDFIID
jgi:hypothetical protein